MMKTAYIIHSKNFNFKKELYEPLLKSSLKEKVNLIPPHKESKEHFDSKKLMKENKNIVIIAELTHPSTGRDMELGMAYIIGIKVIGIHKKGSSVSSSQKSACKIVYEYDSIEEIISKLETALRLC